MAFWKNIKDRSALERLQDEAYHAAAVEEIGSGRRRDGLWAKAIIEGGGDEVKAKVAYLRLLVVALRDEHYLATRAAELRSTHTEASPKPKQQPTSSATVRDKASARRCIESIQSGRAALDSYEELLEIAGGSIESKGFIFGMHYVVRYGGREVRIDHSDDLRGWFIQNVIPNLRLAQI